MERGGSPVLAAPTGQAGGGDDKAPAREPSGRPRPLRDVLSGFGDTCALAAVALLGCLAVIALGTLGSLFWTLVVDR